MNGLSGRNWNGRGSYRRDLLDDDQKLLMLAGCLTNVQVFERAKSFLSKQKILSGFGYAYSVLWSSSLDYYEQHHALPSRKMLYVLAKSALRKEDDQLRLQYLRTIKKFLRWCGQAPVSTPDEQQHILDLCAKFVEDQIVLQTSSELVQEQTTPGDLPQFLLDLHNQVQQVRQVSVPEDDPLFTEGWDRELPVVFISSGLPCLDRFLGGGMVPGEVYGFLGPTGSCKTTLATQLAVHFAQYAASISHSGSQDVHEFTPVSVVVSTEMDRHEARRRFLASSAKIPMDRLMSCLASGQFLESLSDHDYPAATPETEYERDLFIDREAYISERKRYEMTVQLLNKHLLFLDFSGTNGSKYSVPDNGFTGIAQILEALMQRKKLKPVFLVVDHAAALADRLLESARFKGSRPEELRIVLKQIPLSISRFAKRHCIPAVVTHQLSGQASSASPAADLDHTDAADCKAFNHYVDFSILAGRPTDDDLRLAKMQCRKHRRQPPRKYAIVRVDGAFCRVIDVSDQYVIDSMARRIVRARDLQLSGHSSPDEEFDDYLRAAME